MYILVLDGGGSLGYSSAIFLSRIEQELNIPVYKMFNMFSGVSTGSLLAAGLANELSASDVCSMYKEYIPKIFGSPRGWWRRWWSAKYDNTVLTEMVKQKLGDTTIDKAKKKLMIHAVQLTGNFLKPKFWKSWENDDKLYDILTSSCSAPTYFDPYEINGNVFIDGALATNNPSMCAVADALKMGIEPQNIKVLNISCVGLGSYTRKDAKDMTGVSDWMSAAIEVAITASEPLASYQTSQVIGKSNFKLVQSTARIPMDSTDMKEIKKHGEIMTELYIDDVLAFLND